MHRFFRLFFIVLLMVAAFIGGIYSAAFVSQDPFLATFIPYNTDIYDSFIEDIVLAVEEAKASQALLSNTLTNNNEPKNEELNNNINNGKTIETESTYEEDPIEILNEVDEQELPKEERVPAETVPLSPEEFTDIVTEKMTNQEKMAFLIWLKSRFDLNEIQKMNGLVQQGLTQDNMVEIYKSLRNNLKEKDYEYLLSIVDRYLIGDTETVIPAQWSLEEPKPMNDEFGYNRRSELTHHFKIP